MARAAAFLYAREMRPWIIGIVSGVAMAAAVMLTPPPAEGKVSYDSPYGYERTWNAAVRLVRVDNGFKVTEKDDATGYLLFEYRSPEGGGKSTPGSIEMIRGRDAESGVHVVVQLPQMPRYHEQVLIDSLSQKMLREYGEAPQRKKPAPPPAVDAGADAASY